MAEPSRPSFLQPLSPNSQYKALRASLAAQVSFLSIPSFWFGNHGINFNRKLSVFQTQTIQKSLILAAGLETPAGDKTITVGFNCSMHNYASEYDIWACYLHSLILLNIYFVGFLE